MTYGALRYRLQIEGWPDEWVTDPGMVVTLSDGRERRDGLSLDGLELREDINLRESLVEASPITVTVRSRYAAESFAKQPMVRTWLTADLSKDAAAITVKSTVGSAVGDILHMGTEAVQVSSTPGEVVRQYWDTQQQAHYMSYGEDEEHVPLWDLPATMEGRRAYLFKYDPITTVNTANTFDFVGDPQGGTMNTQPGASVIWRGLVSNAPRLASSDGLSWSIDIEPITMVLEQEIAAEADKSVSIAGIYHSCGTPFIIAATDYVPATAVVDDPIQICGHWDSEADFAFTVNSALTTVAANAFTNALTRLEVGFDSESKYTLTAETPRATAAPEVHCFSPLEGITESFWHYANGDVPVVNMHTNGLAQGTTYYKSFLDPGQYVTTGNKSIVYGPYWETAFQLKGRFPRGALGHAPTTLGGVGNKNDLTYKQSQSTTYPDNRIYLSGTLGVDVGDTVILRKVIDPQVVGGIDDAEFEVTVTAVKTSYVEVDYPRSAVALNSSTEIYVGAMYKTDGHVGDFIDAVIDRAPQANNGSTPFITYADIDDDWETAIVGSFGIAPNSTQRRYAFSAPAVLRDVLSEELKLIGCYMHLNSEGRIAISKLEVPTGTDQEAVSITDTDIITPYDGAGGYPMWEPGRDGVVGTVDILTGYDSSMGEHTGPRFPVRSVRTISAHKNRSRGVTEIAPLSRSLSPVTFSTQSEARAIANKYFAVHGHDYYVLTLPVRLGLMDTVFCGDTVRVTSTKIIDVSGTTDGTATGMRGVTNLAGWVIGRRFPLDPSSDAIGELTIRVNRGDLRGYAPAARITSAVTLGGGDDTIWDCAFTQDFFSPDDTDDLDFFAVDYRVRVTQYNTYTPNTGVGVVTSITNATTARITFDAAAPWAAGGTISYDLTFEEATGAPVTAQLEYCYVADANGKLTTDESGFTFG